MNEAHSYLSITLVSYRHTLIDKMTHVEKKKPKLFITSGECGSTLDWDNSTHYADWTILWNYYYIYCCSL